MHFVYILILLEEVNEEYNQSINNLHCVATEKIFLNQIKMH